MPARRDAKQIQFQGFIQIDLDDIAIAAIEEGAKKPGAIWQSVSDIIDDDYKLGVSYDHDNQVVKTTLMDMDASRTSAGWMLSGQAPSLVLAITVLVYKHMTITNSQWTPFLAQKNKNAGLR